MPELSVEVRTVGEVLLTAFAQLRPAVDRPALESEILLSHLLGRPRMFLLAHPEFKLSLEVIQTYTSWVARRVAGEPLPYITGKIEFWGLDFHVTSDVLIPRPETEELVDAALRWGRSNGARRAVDVGTGSGCIAVVLALTLPALRLEAVDRSPAALAVARSNALLHDVEDRITFVEGDLLEPVLRPVDLIVSNPPYVADWEWEALPTSVKQEPRMALLGGPEGLDLIRRLLAMVPQRLRPGGLLLMEIGERQGAAVVELARQIFPGAEAQIVRDLAGRDRILRLVAPE